MLAFAPVHSTYLECWLSSSKHSMYCVMVRRQEGRSMICPIEKKLYGNLMRVKTLSVAWTLVTLYYLFHSQFVYLFVESGTTGPVNMLVYAGTGTIREGSTGNDKCPVRWRYRPVRQQDPSVWPRCPSQALPQRHGESWENSTNMYGILYMYGR